MQQPTKAQRGLKILSTINLVLGILALVSGLFITIGGTNLAFTSASGSSDESLGAVGLILGIVIVLSGIADIAGGILGRRASADNTKVKPAYWFGYICLAFSTFGLFDLFFEGNATPSNIVTAIVGLAFNFAYMVFVSQVKTEAGE